MKSIKKAISLILVLTIFALMAMGSGSGNSNDGKTPSSNSSGSPSSVTPAKDVTIEETVIFDQGGIKVTAKSFNEKGTFGPEVKVLIENDGSIPVTVQTRDSSVNGYMVETMFSSDVAVGKKANDSITFMRSDLTVAGISTIADVEFKLHIYNSETWDTIYDSEPIVLKTSAAEGFEYKFDSSGSQVYNGNGVEIVVKGLSTDANLLGPSIVVYISNTSGRNIIVQTRDVSVNGFMIDPIFSSDVIKGKHAIDTITFMKSNLEENDIANIETVEMSFHIYDMDSWDTIADTSPITVNFN